MDWTTPSQRLLLNVRAASELLASFGETHWSNWLRRRGDYVERGQHHGITELLGGFGGMGSFNDLVIGPHAGHDIPESEIDRCNERLDALRSEIWTDARALAQEPEVPVDE